jgi:futalosine hydrolase
VAAPTIVIASDLEWQALEPLHGFNHIMTGVGMPAVYRSFLKLQTTGPLINIGIGGAYPGTGLAVGDVVIVGSEVVGDLGMELSAHPNFVPLRDFPFGSSHKTVNLFRPNLADVPVVSGCTVSTVTGTDETGIRRRDQFAASVETMEGFAVADIANATGVRCFQLRAISNIAAERNMQPANIRIALDALCAFWVQHGMGILEALNEA